MCAVDTEYIDTSQMDGSVADLRNLKIYVTDDEDSFDQIEVNPDFSSDLLGENQGVVGLHELSDEIIRSVQVTMGHDAEQKKDVECLIQDADRVVVLVDGETGSVVDFFLFDGSDEEASDDEESDGVEESLDREGKGSKSGLWTCLRVCLR